LTDNFVIGLDLGTTGLKLQLVDQFGLAKASAFKSYPLLHPRPAWAEQEPRSWMRAAEEGVGELLRLGRIAEGAVKAIGIASQIDGVVPIDREGEPLHNAMIWMDRRAKSQCNRIKSMLSDEEFYEITGLSIDPSHVAPKILWIRDNHKNIFDRADCFLMPGNYLLYNLTGKKYTDHSNASCSMLYDIRRATWSDRLCEIFGIAAGRLPEVRDSTFVAGELQPRVAKKCGLAGDVKVVVGGGDEEVGAVGAGTIDQGAFLDLTGTAEPMCLCLDRPSLDPTRLLECHAHAYPGKWLLENTGGLAGGVYGWFRDQFGTLETQQAAAEGTDAYEILNREISSVPPGSHGLLFLPFLSGSILPEWNPDARGAFLGITLGHERKHFARSLMEGTAYVLRDMLEHLKDIGLTPTRIVLAGGGARARIWRQIKTDIINRKTITCSNQEVTALGAAILALVGVGLYRNIDEAVNRIVSLHDELTPANGAAETYAHLYGLYRRSYESLKTTFREIASFQE